MKQTVNNFGKSGSVKKTASPDGIKTMNTQGAPKGVNPNKGYSTAANLSGVQGGMPGFGNKGTGGGSRTLKNVHMGQAGSGHNKTESARSANTGYGTVKGGVK